MTFYLHPYPFDIAQGRPYRRVARRWSASNERALGVNIREEDDAYVLSALVPGLKSEDLSIQVLEDIVRIEGEYKRSTPQSGSVDKADETAYLMQELPHGSFKRTLRLPAVIDADHVEAKITDGVLTLRLPKAESARPKKIKITSK
ncbi:MAG: Hsp20/alpha crystallin family protein [Anaerolineae bacterium]|nr:Hsp20/alpha crystallin family protein [Anaerolineae bacterium]MCI0609669.1 Hsp20/alpha crystallin family protein [Anaerolineae bacterium]